MEAVEEVIRFDDAAATAAADSRFATSMQEVSSPLPAEFARRDATPIKPVLLQETRLEKLVAGDPALQWVEEDDDYGHNIASRAMCVWCVYTSKSCADEAKLLPELMNHLRSKEHNTRRQYRGGLPAIFSATAGPSSPPPPPPDLTRLCWGFHKPELEVNGRILKTHLLLEHDTSKLDWFAEPNTQEEFESATTGQPPLCHRRDVPFKRTKVPAVLHRRERPAPSKFVLRFLCRYPCQAELSQRPPAAARGAQRQDKDQL